VRRGLALPVVLSLVTILILIAISVASTGIATLNLAGAQASAAQSVYAAEAGIAASFRAIIEGTPGWTGFSNVPFGQDSRYSVQVIAGPSSGPGRPDVPANTVYLLATGTTRGRFPRQVGVLLAASGLAPSSAFRYAIAAGGRLDLQGGGSVTGSLKASTDLRMQGGIRVLPAQGNGRMLAGGDIDIGNGIRRDPSQDLRAQGTVSVGPSTYTTSQPVQQIFPSDSTPDSAPFIADGRFSNTLNTGEVGEVLPNPDPQLLLGLTPDGAGDYVKDALGNYTIDPARTDVVLHPETTSSGLALDGKIHFFPNGVTFSGGGAFSGQGTIVSGAGNPINISGNQGGKVNLLALRWPGQGPSGGNPSINLSGSSDYQGLILAHEDVNIGGNFRLSGILVAYRPNGGDIDGGGNRRIVYDTSGLNLPGLESWLNPPASPPAPTAVGIPSNTPLQVLSWQRL
jgi:hypothetical protein